MNAAASRLKKSEKFLNFSKLFPDATAAPHRPEKAVQEALFKAEREEFFILSSEWLPLTSMNAAASRLKRSGKSFKFFLSHFRTPLLPRIARKKRSRKLYTNRKEKRIF